MVYRTKLPDTASVANCQGGGRLFAPSAEKNSAPIINLIKQKVDKFNKPFIYCNMVGGQDELIFDGSSLAFNQNSELVANGRPAK